jgi:uncharacterized protein (TIGR02996 family)
MRTFQFRDAKSHKFWHIDVAGTEVTVTFGKIGAAGQTQTKTFATPEAARAEADKLIREKVKKGYAETTPAPTASNAEAFERALVANPDDAAGWSAYADYLAEQGDPRGEFMQVQLALENESLSRKERDDLRAREAALLEAHERTWLGSLTEVVLDPPTPRYDWSPRASYRFRRGWLAELNFPRVGVEAARAAVRAPGTQFLATLGIVGAAYEAPEGAEASEYIDGRYAPGPDLPDPPGDNPGLHVLVKFPRLAGVRSFRLGNPPTDQFEESDQCHTDGELAYHFLKQLPNVEEVYLLAHRVDANKIYALPMPRLRVLMHYHHHAYPLDKLAANPTLTHLAQLYCFPHGMEPGDDEPYIRLRHLRAICRSPYLTALTHLRLRATDVGDAGAKELVESGVFKRLKVLDLRYGCMSDAGARTLAACPDVKNLEYLDLSENALTPAGIQALKATGIKLTAQNMHDQTEFDPEGDNEFLWMGDPE